MEYLYDFDPTGSSPLNHIANEVQTINAATARIMVPTNGLFYSDDLIVTKVSNSAILVLNTDYKLEALDPEITALTGLPIAGAISFINAGLLGDVSLDYQAVGGPQGSNSSLVFAIRDRIDELLVSGLSWVDTLDKPSTYPPNQHLVAAPSEITGLAGLRDALLQINESIVDNRVVPYGAKSLHDRLNKLIALIANHRNDINTLGLYGTTLGDVQDTADALTTLIATAQSTADDSLVAANAALASANDTIDNLLLILKPTITSPIEGTTGFDHTLTINSDAYATAALYVGTHASTDWEVSDTSDFAIIRSSSYLDTVNLLEWYGNGLVVSTLYYVRCRYHSDNHVSEWSDYVSFTTASDLGYLDISLTSPVNNATDIALLPTLQSSAFTVVDGTDTHSTTDWQIASDNGFTSIVYQALASGDLLSHTVATDLSNDTVYYVRVRHHGVSYTSDWSATVSITTTDFVEAMLLIGGAGFDIFWDIKIDDTTGNYVCVGYSTSAGAGVFDAYIAVFDSNLNLINDRLIGGAGSEAFQSITIDDTTGNYVCVGYSDSAGAAGDDAYIAIFDTDLLLVNDRLIGGAGNDVFWGIKIDPSTGNYICIGESTSAGAGLWDAYIAIFDTSLNLVNDRLIGGAGNDVFFNGTIDPSNGNYICVGYSESAGAGLQDAYIAVMDTSLNLVNDRLIGGAGNDVFLAIIIDPSNGNYVCVGYSTSAGAGGDDAYIAVFDSNLTLVNDALIGGAGTDRFWDINIDPLTGNYICVGYSESAGAGLQDAYIAIFDINLVLQNDTLIGGTGNDVFYSIDIDPSNGNYICVGYSTTAGAGSDDAFIMTFLSDLTLADGAIPGIASLGIFSPVLTETIPALTVSSPALVTASPAFTETSPTFTITDPAFTETFSLY